MPTLQEQVTTAVTDITTDRDKLHAIVHGPASGTGSVVATAAGNVASVAKVLSEITASQWQIWLWSTATSGDPGTGKLLLNHATATSATALHISKTSDAGNALASWLATWDDSASTIKGRVRLFSHADATSWIDADVTAISDQTTYYVVTIASPTAGAGSRIANDRVAVSFLPIGDKGDTGANGTAAGLDYAFNTATSGDPGSGKLLLNNATATSATALLISKTGRNSESLGTVLSAWSGSTSTIKGHVRLFDVANRTKWVEASVTAVTDNSTYYTMTITSVAAGTAISNAAILAVEFRAKGDKGDTGATGSYVSAATNLFPDPFFDISRGDKSFKVAGKELFKPDFATRTWVGDYKHSFGVGAWYHALDASISGYACHFGDMTEIGTDDTVSVGIIFVGPNTKNVNLRARFFANAPGTWVGSTSDAYVAGTGGEVLVKIDSIAIPAGATGVALIPYSLSSDNFHVVAAWCNLNAVAGVQPPPRRRRAAEAPVVRAAAGDLHPMVEAVLKQRSLFSNSGRTIVTTPTMTAAPEGGSTFIGWGDSYETPGSISFNAVRIPRTARADGTPEWYRCKIVVRTHATAPAGSSSTLLGVGETFLDPDARSADDTLVLVRDVVTGALKTITQVDLLTRFFVGYVAYARDGSVSRCGTVDGSITGLTRYLSYYITEERDPLVAAWSAVSGNPPVAIGLEQLTSPVQTYETLPRLALSNAMAAPPVTTLLTAPAPWEPVLPPRIYAMVGREANVYLRDMHSGAVPREYNVTCAVGKQQIERWTAVPVTAANDVSWSVAVRDADHGGVLAAVTVMLQVGSTTAAAGASRRVLAIGDSTTDAGRWTQRMLDIATANASAAQITLMGTRGSGANKHEGRSGWNLDQYYQSDSVSGVDNPFVTAPGNKFDMAAYLTATSQAAPDIVVWHLGINDVFAQETEVGVNAVMDAMIDKLQRMIGLTADAAVGSVLESNANAVNIIAMPISPANQDGFAEAYANGQTRWQHKRNITIAAYRLKEAFKSSEGSRVYLLPWNVTIDTERGFEVATAAGNANTAITATRPIDGIHPNDEAGQVGGYQQMGDAAYACINWLVHTGRSPT